MSTRICTMALAGSLVLFAGSAPAQTYDSTYTDLDLAACETVYAYEVGADYACPGYAGIPVFVSESDLRVSVSYGPNAPEERAASQGFSQFNNPGARIEWLLDANGQAVGTILRWFIAKPDAMAPDNQILVVTRIAPGATCQIAHIDARANADANQLARDAANALLAGFDCSNEPVRYGRFTAF